MTVRLPLLLSVPVTLAAPLGAHAMPNDDPRGSIGSRGDGEVIVINDCRPGSVRWNIDGAVHCVSPIALPNPTPPPPQGDPDRGQGGCEQAPSSGPVAACGGGGTRRPNRREKCIKEAQEWENECKRQTVAYSVACNSASYDLAIGLCTVQGVFTADGKGPRQPCTSPVLEGHYNEADQAWEWTVQKNHLGKPIHWDPAERVPCDDPRGCAGSWLHGRPGATVSSEVTSSWGTNGSLQVGVPGFSAGLGGNTGGGQSMTVEIKYDPRLGAYAVCAQGTQAWATACVANAGEKAARCPR
jgi:hypothetical protein